MICCYPSRVRKIAKTTITFVITFYLSACPSVQTEELGSHYTNFHKILYFRTFRNYVKKIRVSLKYDNNSFSSLSYDRSKASSKASSPHSAIQSFLLQMRVSSPFLKSSNSFLRLLPCFPVTSIPLVSFLQ